jgi:kynurenine formamidase
MCVPGCLERVQAGLNRRGFLGGAAGAAAAATAMAAVRPAVAAEPRSFTRVVDLTHTLSPTFPTFDGKPGVALEDGFTLAKDGYNLKIWTLNEHTGTHMDSPFHFSQDGWAVERIPAANLVCPLCVVDITARAAEDADAQLTPDDIRAFEGKHGPIPTGACVAMRSGWDRHAGEATKFRNADEAGVMHFPGFHPEAAAMLMEGREVVGIASDTLSLDFGASKDFAAHRVWLPTGRWGIECIASLAELPATGATLVVGAPKVEGATGGPVRLLALA